MVELVAMVYFTSPRCPRRASNLQPQCHPSTRIPSPGRGRHAPALRKSQSRPNPQTTNIIANAEVLTTLVFLTDSQMKVNVSERRINCRPCFAPRSHTLWASIAFPIRSSARHVVHVYLKAMFPLL